MRHHTGMPVSDHNKTYLWLGAVIMAGLAVRIALFNGMTCYDEFAYAHIANNIAQGNFKIEDVSGYYGFRYLLTLPAAVLIKMFGMNEFSLSLWPLICSLGNICVVYLIGRLLFNPGTGLLAAFLCGFFPFSVTYGTVLYPEEIIAFLLGLSVYFFLRADKTDSGTRAAGLFILSGLFAGLAYLSRLNALLIFIFYGFHGFFKPNRLRFLFAPAGLLLVLLPEAVFYYLKTGDLLFSWHSQQQKLLLDAVNFSTSLWIYPEAMFGLNMYGLSLFGFFYHLFAAALAYFLYKKRFFEILPVFLWFVCLFMYLEFGPSHVSMSGYAVAHKQLRFLSIVTMPVCLIIAAFLLCLKKEIRAVIACLLLATSVTGAWKMSGYRNEEAAPFLLAYGYVKESTPESVFVSGSDWVQRLNFYFKTPLSLPYYRVNGTEADGRVRQLREISGPGALKGVWLVVDRRELPAADEARNPAGLKLLENAIKKADRSISITGFVKLYHVR